MFFRMVDTVGTTAKDLFSSVTLHYSLVRSLIDWNRIDQVLSGLLLCLLPEESRLSEKLSNSKEDILDQAFEMNPTLPLKCVVSVNEKVEITNGRYWGVNTVTPDDWQVEAKEDESKEGDPEDHFEHLIIEMPDFQADVDNTKLIEVLIKIHKHRMRGHTAVIHCKAGRARSVMTCLDYLATCVINSDTGKIFTYNESCDWVKLARAQAKLDDQLLAKALTVIDDFHYVVYLLKYIKNPETLKKYTFQEACDSMKAARLQPHLFQAILEKAQTVREELPKEEKELKPIFEVEFANFLSSKQVKNQISKLESIIKLKHYAIDASKDHLFKSCNRTSIINQLIELIKRPYSEAWYFTLFTPKGLLAKLKAATPDKPSAALSRDQDIRSRLVENVKEDVFKFVADHFLFLGKKDPELLAGIRQIAERGRESKGKEDKEIMAVAAVASVSSKTECLGSVPYTLYHASCALDRGILDKTDQDLDEFKMIPRLGRVEA